MHRKAIFGLLIAVAWFVAKPVFAHPLDISVSELNVLPDSRKIEVSTYLHPYEGNYLLEEINGFRVDKIGDFYLHEDIFFTYLQRHLTFANNGVPCSFKMGEMPPKDEIEIVADGIQIDYAWICQGALDKLSFSNSLFIEDFSLQTNKMMFYLKGKYDKTIYEKVLTTKVDEDHFNLSSPPDKEANKLNDIDKDGLSDYEESLYLADPAIKDTDFDGYTDKEEVDNGWDARNPLPSPGQVMRVPTGDARRQQETYWGAKPAPQNETVSATPDSVTGTEASIADSLPVASSSIAMVVTSASSTTIQMIDDSVTTAITSESSKNPDKPSGAFLFQNERLKRILQIVKDLLSRPGFGSKLLVIFPVFLLGFLHSFEGGHGKSVLISYLVGKDRTLWDGLKFCLTITLTDLAGIFILGVGFEILILSGSASAYMGSLQTIGAWMLLGIGMFLLLKGIIRYIQPWREQHEHDHSHAVTLGFLAGLVPCTSGWALILMVISLNQVKWIVPIILVFGSGVFLFLIGLSALTIKLRGNITKKVPWLAKISSIVSGALVVLVACLVLKVVYWP